MCHYRRHGQPGVRLLGPARPQPSGDLSCPKGAKDKKEKALAKAKEKEKATAKLVILEQRPCKWATSVRGTARMPTAGVAGTASQATWVFSRRTRSLWKPCVQAR